MRCNAAFPGSIAGEENAAGLFRASFTPYFSAYAGGRKRCPIAVPWRPFFVDSSGNVKTCWNGTPIGKVGMIFKDWRKSNNIHGKHCR